MKGNANYNGVGKYKSIDKKTKVVSRVVILILFIILVISGGGALRKLMTRNITDNTYVETISNTIESSEVVTVEKQEQEESIYINSYLTEDENSFINLILEGSIKGYEKYKILPSITIAQAILESGWGKSELAVSHNNLFGIKADSRWDGAVATIISSENYNEAYKSNFRKYDYIEESIEDHGKFLFDNPRYRETGLFEGKTYIEQSQALEEAGYSTVKNEKGESIYADKLISIIEKYNLMIYDEEVNK